MPVFTAFCVGVSEETILSVPNQGSVVGGRHGDLLISFKIHQHPLFTRKGLDIYANVSVPLHIALLGGTVNVPTIKGSIEVRIKAGSQSGELKRVSGHGVQTSDGKSGDQYMRLVIEIPK
jgi:DnaJ-class molecular chaperone